MKIHDVVLFHVKDSMLFIIFIVSADSQFAAVIVIHTKTDFCHNRISCL